MMRKFSFLCIAMVLLFSSFPPGTLRAQNYIEVREGGKIDWANGVVEAYGRGVPSENSENPAQARSVAEREALRAARWRLFEIIKGLRIDFRTTAEDLLTQSDGVREGVNSQMKNSEVVGLTYMEDGSVEATVAIRLTGPFAELVLPKNIRIINPVRQPRTDNKKDEDPYTGVVIDCRGFWVEAALVPRVVDEGGEVVYGPAYVSRNHAVEIGMAAYGKDLVMAQSDPRVARRPLIVKGIRTAKTGESDIVISNADAAKIRGTAKNLDLLQKCKVIIVVD